MKKIFATTLNAHDHNWYDGVLHYQSERYTRHKRNVYKGCWKKFYDAHFLPRIDSEIFTFTYTGGGVRDSRGIDVFETILKDHYENINAFRPSNLWDYYYKDNIYYINHHQSHMAYSFLSSQYEEADCLAVDGGGMFYRAMFADKNGHIKDASIQLALGWLWNMACIFTGFHTLDAGKLMGLAGYGKYNSYVYSILELHNEELRKYRDKFYFANERVMKSLKEQKIPKEDIAFTMQQYTNDKIMEYLEEHKTSDNLCLSGGVAYNEYMNELCTKMYKNVYVPPAVGDEGQSLGSYMHADYIINKNIHIPSVYSGQEYDIDMSEPDYHEIAKQIADGKIIGWYQGKSESGNRALGNRSILADPRNPNIKDIINSKIKLREDFRPFAPSVLEEYYQDYFDTDQPSPYMSRIVPVISDAIPGVTHVDRTARIQTVTKIQNERYYKLISAFHDITGIPMLLNTSFNCQEPIVETPEDAMKTFKKCGLDTLVLGGEMICK